LYNIPNICQTKSPIEPGASSQGSSEIDNDRKTNIKGKEMNEISLMAIIRLDTELENAIGFRDHYLKRAHDTGNYIMHDYYDSLINEIIEDIIQLGAQ
jgi:hypothetical protein